MYKITVITKYNTIKLETEDYISPEIQELLSQPYVISVSMEKVKEEEREKPNVKIRKRTKE